MPSGMNSCLTIHAITTRPERALMFHIGHEMVECLMRKPNPTEKKRECLEGHLRPKSSGERHLRVARGALDLLIGDTVASALLVALRWLF